MTEEMAILVTVDENYLEPLETMLFSLREHHLNQRMTIWLIHEDIPKAKLEQLQQLIDSFGWQLAPVAVTQDIFKEAPTVTRYPKEMYFRLLCGKILPKEVERILYLDPDLLVINSLNPLWELDLEGKLLAAASHRGVTNITNSLNQLRLNTDHPYYNSGVMLLDLERARETISIEAINETIDKYGPYLLLPDQDVLNHLYGKYVKEVPDDVWNYDARKYVSYLAKSMGEYDIHQVMNQTAIVHFCGKPKPWQEKSDTRFTGLYLDYVHRLKHYKEQHQLVKE